MKRIALADIRDTRPVFIVSIAHGGTVYRFAQRPLTLSSDDGDLPYLGSLDFGGFKDTLPRPGVVDDGGTASMAVTFRGLDIAAEYAALRSLELAPVELSMVLLRGSRVVTAYEDRWVLLSGTIQRPQFGFPDRPAGFVGFTASSRPADDKTPIIKPHWRVNSSTWSQHNDSNKDGITGSVYPWVFGQPGDSLIPGSPGYLIDDTGSPKRILVSVGRVEATQVVLWDEDGDRDNSAPITHELDGLGTLCAWADPVGAGAINTTGGRHYVGWAAGGGGATNPNGSGFLTKSGDLLRYLFGQGNIDADHAAFIAMSPILDQYEFAGYINDPTVSTWQFVRSKILPLLPIALRVGSRGVYPVNLSSVGHISSLQQVTAGAARAFERTSPVQVTRALSDVTNTFGLNWYLNARDSRLTKTSTLTVDENISTRTRVQATQRSVEMYGSREGPGGDASYIYSTATTDKILRWQAYTRGFLTFSAQYTASHHWGWLHVGDQISLTDSGISLVGKRATIASKVWDRAGGVWWFELSWSAAPMESNL